MLIGVVILLLGNMNRRSTPPEPEPEPQGTITLGDISDEPVKKIERFQPLADYLAARLTDFGIRSGSVKIASDMESMTRFLKSGEVDLYFDSLYPAMIVSERSGATPILRRWKDGDAIYYSIVFCRKDSGIASLSDLRGHMIAFEKEYSTSGYMLPMAFLIESGLKPVEKLSVDSEVKEHEVGYVFSTVDRNTIQWVLNQKIVAGATDSRSYAEISEQSRSFLKILAETEKVPRQLVVARPNMDPSLLSTIKSILIEMNETEEGRDVLDTFKHTARFDEFPEGAEAALKRMRELYTLVQKSTM